MKAISLKQPFASLVASGQKTIETRKWKTNYRGDLLICSSQNPKIAPAGYALCVVELYDVKPMAKEHEDQACCKLYPKANAWFLRNLRVLDPIVPIKGQLSLFELPKEFKLSPFLRPNGKRKTPLRLVKPEKLKG